MNHLLSLLALVPLLCSPELPTTPATSRVLFHDAEAKVMLNIGRASGFPDPVGSWEVEVITRGTRQSVLSGHAQVHGLGHARAVRLPSGELAAAVDESVCSITQASARCEDTSTGRVDPSILEALAWRSLDATLDLRRRLLAALALEAHDPSRAEAALRDLADRSYTYIGDPSLAVTIHATLARLRRNDPELRALRAELPESSNAFMIGLARACVLHDPITTELAQRPESVREAVDAARERCPPTTHPARYR